MAGYDDIQSGSLIEYQFLWSREALRGETEGRKKRPCVVVLRLGNRVILVPVTTKEPGKDSIAIPFPELEARRLKMGADIRRWVILDEINEDEIPSLVLEPSSLIGALSKPFRNQLLLALKANIRKVRKTSRAE